MITAVDCTILRFNPKQLLPTFFNLYSQSDNYLTTVAKECTGTTRNRISRSNLGQTPIPVPQLPEQQRIVAMLDEAFAGLATAKANAEKNLQNARALFESHLQLVFKEGGEGWVEKPFEDCIEDVTYTTKIQRKEFLKVGNFPIVSQEADFINGFWNNAADVFRVTRPVVIFGDHTQVLKYIDFDFVLGADGVKILPPKLFLNPKFFYYCLRSIPVNSLGYARHYRLLKELEIRYPDRSMQAAIAKRFEVLEAETQRLTQLYERKLAALEELKKSHLHQAFNGEL
jgi:type I restriction enzyme S subunit